MPAYQDEQERNLETVRDYLACTSLRVDRCRHESNTTTAIWVFDQGGRNGEERQIASISAEVGPETSWKANDGAIVWRVCAMLHGSPVSERRVPTLLDAVGETMRATKGL